MFFLGLVLFIFGIIVIANPAIIAYLIGFFFVFAGLNLLVLTFMVRKAQNANTGRSWNVGGYEITRRTK